jgi:hypothetical protein
MKFQVVRYRDGITLAQDFNDMVYEKTLKRDFSHTVPLVPFFHSLDDDYFSTNSTSRR